MREVNITVYSDGNDDLKFVECLPSELGFAAESGHFSIRYPDLQVIVWVVTKLTGHESYNALQRAIRQARERVVDAY
jgi:hypothetical protein